MATMSLASSSVDVTGMELLKTIGLHEVQQHFGDRQFPLDVPEGTSFEYVASYNWLKPADIARRSGKKPENPIMVVPGAPSVFRAWSGGQMEPDEDVAFADENRYFAPNYPMEPLFRAILLEGLDPLGLQTLDIVTDRYNLRKLYDLCKYRRTSQHRPPKPFHMKIERIGSNLVVFEQCSDVEHQKRSTPIYGKRFEELCTTARTELTKGSHYAIIKYDLEPDLSCLVRFSADSVIWEEGEAAAKVSGGDITPKFFTDSKLKYIVHGYRKHDFKYLELTTRTEEALYPDYIWDQMYFGRIEKIFIGWHDAGRSQYQQLFTINEVRKRMKSPEIVPYALKALRLLLRQLVDYVRRRPAGERYVLSYDTKTPGVIRLYKQEETAETAPEAGMVPSKLRKILEEGAD